MNIGEEHVDTQWPIQGARPYDSTHPKLYQLLHPPRCSRACFAMLAFPRFIADLWLKTEQHSQLWRVDRTPKTIKGPRRQVGGLEVFDAGVTGSVDHATHLPAHGTKRHRPMGAAVYTQEIRLDRDCTILPKCRTHRSIVIGLCLSAAADVVVVALLVVID
jgi:hypothetical protein